VRFWKDIPGQEKRMHVRERICPIAGSGVLSKSERKRKAREIIQASGADSPEFFRKVVTQSTGITFREQSKIWLQNSLTRKRKPIRVTSAEDAQRALDKWILPEIGDLPLSEAAKHPAMKSLVARMNAGKLSPKSVNTYFRIAASVVASAEDADGNPLYSRKWNPEKLDLPIVDRKQQRRPTINENTMTFLASCRKPNERMLFILCAATGMRIGEVLGLEIEKHFADDFTTILVRQQAKNSKLTTDLKTKNAVRDIDVHPEVARLLREFIGSRKKGLLFGSRQGTPLNRSNIRNRILYPMLEAMGANKGGAHVFRRFRATWLRMQKTPEDLIRLWLGHGQATVTDLYVNIGSEKVWRKKEAERVGVGFVLPTSVVPNVPKSNQHTAAEVAA
jgi:integrase